jgi:hypothetical protein
MKDMGEWEKKIEMQEYKVMLVCCGVDDMKVTLVREVEAVLVEGKETPVVVSHVKQQEVWVNQVLQMGQLDKMMSQLEELSGGLKRIFGELTVGRLAVGKFSQDGLMYRVVVEEVLREEERVVVRYLDFGNEEELDYGDLFELPADLLCVPQLAVCVKVLVVEENKLEEMLDMENVSVVVEQKFGTFYTNGLKITDNVLSFEDNTNLGVNPGNEIVDKFSPTVVTLSHIESVSVVWVTPVTAVEMLDDLMGQMADMVDRLVPAKDVIVGSMVVARYTEDLQLYRATVLGVVDTKVTVQFVDYGNYQECPISSLYNLPIELSVERVAPAAIRVTILEGESWQETEENRVVVETLLEKENLTLNLKMGIFSVHGEEIDFSKFLKIKAAENQNNSTDQIIQNKVPFKQTLDQEPECLREEAVTANVHLPGLDQVLADDDKERLGDQSATDLAMSQAVYEEEAVGPSPDKF